MRAILSLVLCLLFSLGAGLTESSPWSASEEQELALPVGGVVRARLSGALPKDAHRWRLFLQPLKVESPVDPDLLSQKLKLEGGWWRNLPSGTYRLLLNPQVGEVLRGPSTRELMRLSVSAGRQEDVTVVLPEGLDSAFIPRDESGTDLWLSPRLAEAGMEIQGELEVQRFDAGGTAFLSVASPLSLADGIALPGGCIAGKSYLLATAKQISLPVLLSQKLCSGEARLTAELRPASRLKGTVLARGPIPSYGLVTAAPCDGIDGKVSPLTFPLIVSPQGSFEIKLPSGCQALELSLAPWASVPLGRLEMEADQTIDLGLVPLNPGGGFIARVLDDDSLKPAVGIEVSLFQLERMAEAEKQNLRSAEMATTSRTDGGGWVRFSALPEGAYHLRLLPADASRSPAFFGPFQVPAGTDMVSEDLLLPRPAQVVLRVEPGIISNPEEFKLRLNAYHLPSCGLPPQRLSEQPEGVTFQQDRRMVDIPPGRSRLSIQGLSPFGGAFSAAIVEEELFSGQTSFIEVTVRGSLYRGLVLRGQQRARARLEFFPLAGAGLPGSSIPTVYADHEGLFEVLLPEPGSYRVRAQLSSVQAVMDLGEVEFQDPDKIVEIKIPDSEISGRVVDPEGRPVSPAAVIAVLEDQVHLQEIETGATVSEGGEFLLRGLVPGRWRLSAAAWEEIPRRSRSVWVQLADQEHHGDTVLVVEANEVIEGQVQVDGLYPLGGAHLHVETYLAESASGSFPFELETDRQGRFELRPLPGSASYAQVVLEAQGLPLVLRKVTLRSPLKLVVPRLGGTVKLPPEYLPEANDGFVVLLVAADGAHAAVGRFLASRYGSLPADQPQAVVGPLAPGPWKLVRVLLDPSSPAMAALRAGADLSQLPGLAFEVVAGENLDLAPAVR
jgi:hypothetical protein